MAKTKRREMLASLGMLGGGVLLGAGSRIVGAQSAAAPASPQTGAPAQAWRYHQLDPAGVGETAYRIYPGGGCMYALVGSVLLSLADIAGEPYRSFPLDMLRYGEGGVGGWGSTCGVVNGGAMVIGLFHGSKEKEPRESLLAEFLGWYEATALPRFQPAKPEWAPEVPASVAGSVLCHLSLERWCEVSQKSAFSMEKRERCRRLASDGAMKAVEILNRAIEGQAGLVPSAQACTACHGSKGRGDAFGKMSCAPCHKLPNPHP